MSDTQRPTKRPRVPATIRDEVLREAGYKCANPTCRNIITLDTHHINWVKDGGGNEATNLIALCGHCHDMHTQGHIPRTAIRHWKGILHALNHALGKESMDLLLFLADQRTKDIWYSGDGVLRFAGLIAAGLACFGSMTHIMLAKVPGPGPNSSIHVHLTEKGRALVDAWLAGDERSYRKALEAPPAS